ncbi:hypothetical protein DPMN_097032 [Dreissena polymorpha]|uniref:Uncharacterized protein n=1 Tax=Dreissena polymorpha TaxID=45954 RepID=A0A9D4R4C8_DREPO|nr:hypothetical protein DPMN_097032 [Dreissena polymorpha]
MLVKWLSKPSKSLKSWSFREGASPPTPDPLTGLCQQIFPPSLTRSPGTTPVYDG